MHPHCKCLQSVFGLPWSEGWHRLAALPMARPIPFLPGFTVFTPGNAEKVGSNGIHEIQAVLQWKRVFNFCLLGSLRLNCNCWRGVGAGAGMNGSGGVSALQSLSPLSAFKGWCVLCGSFRKRFCIQLSKKPRRFPAGFDLAVRVWMTVTCWRGTWWGKHQLGVVYPPLCSWSCSRCPLSVLQPIKGENYNGDSKAFGKTH